MAENHITTENNINDNINNQQVNNVDDNKLSLIIFDIYICMIGFVMYDNILPIYKIFNLFFFYKLNKMDHGYRRYVFFLMLNILSHYKCYKHRHREKRETIIIITNIVIQSLLLLL